MQSPALSMYKCAATVHTGRAKWSIGESVHLYTRWTLCLQGSEPSFPILQCGPFHSYSVVFPRVQHGKRSGRGERGGTVRGETKDCRFPGMSRVSRAGKMHPWQICRNDTWPLQSYSLSPSHKSTLEENVRRIPTEPGYKTWPAHFRIFKVIRTKGWEILSQGVPEHRTRILHGTLDGIQGQMEARHPRGSPQRMLTSLKKAGSLGTAHTTLLENGSHRKVVATVSAFVSI